MFYTPSRPFDLRYLRVRHVFSHRFLVMSWKLNFCLRPDFRFVVLTGMPEMLKPTSLIMGAGLGMDVACLTDGRFSGG